MGETRRRRILVTWDYNVRRTMRFNGEPVVRLFAMVGQLPVPADRTRSGSEVIRE